MVKFISCIFKTIKRCFLFCLDLFIKILPVYWKSFDKIKLWNWYQILNGNMKALYKFNFFNRIPLFFLKIAEDMFYSMDEMDLTLLRLKADMTVLKSIAVRNNDKSMLFKADSMAKEIETMENKSDKGMNLNQFINYIELSLECPGTIDPYKITASRAFSLYHRAIERNKRLRETYKRD